MSKPPTSKGGRPLLNGTGVAANIMVRVTEAQKKKLIAYTEEWGCNRAEVFRRIFDQLPEIKPEVIQETGPSTLA